MVSLVMGSIETGNEIVCKIVNLILNRVSVAPNYMGGHIWTFRA